jgi:hypothetical protein
MKPGPRGPDGNPEGGRNLGQRMPQVVMEHDDRALLRRQTAEGALEGVTVRDGVRRVGIGGRFETNDPDPGGESPRRSSFRVARMNDEPVEPGVEASGVAERGQVAPGADERLLGRVLGAVVIAQNPVGKGVAAVDGRRREGREGVKIPALRPLDELDLHAAALGGAARLAASPSMEPAAAETFSASRFTNGCRAGMIRT